jgi:hypothetical protein
MRTLLHAAALFVLAARAGAQAPAPAPAPEPVPVPAPEMAPRPAPTLANVRVELTLSDQAGARPPVKKTMTLTLGDGERGSVRSRPQIAVTPQPGSPTRMFQTLPLNVDARPVLVSGRIKLLLIVEYSSAEQSQPGGDAVPKADVNFSGQVLLESGRPMVVAEAADPVSDRRVTVEVKATVLK